VIDDALREKLTKTSVVYHLENADAVTVRRGIEFAGSDGAPLTMDLYDSPDAPGAAPRPAVIIVFGYADPGFERLFGCRFKDTAGVVSWARLIAASGMTAITATNREPVGDFHALLGHVAEHADVYGIEASRLCLWASSGNVPLALSALMSTEPSSLACAAFSYGYTLDLDGSTAVADAARTFKFTNPCAGKSAHDLRVDVPMFVARAGRDEMPGLNQALDRFVAAALSRNVPLTLVNHAEGPHAFDLFDDSGTSREIVKQILAFLAFHAPLARDRRRI